MVGDINVKPEFSGEVIGVSAVVTVGSTKAYMGEKTETGYPFFWKKEGESLMLSERARLKESDLFTATQSVNSSAEYSVSADAKTANFAFELQELTNGYALEYACLSPASCFVRAEDSGILVDLSASQTPSKSAPDPNVCLLWNKSGVFAAQPTSLSYTKGFNHPLAYVTFNVKNLPLLPGEEVCSVSLTFEEKAVSGELLIDWEGKVTPTENSRSFVNIKTDNVDVSEGFSVCFTAIPFDLDVEDKILVSVQTNKSVLSRTIEVPKKMPFPAGEMTIFGADMENASRKIQTAVRFSSGVEYTLNEVSKGVYEQTIPYSGAGSMTFLYLGAEYGQMASSGSGMVGTHSSGVHLSRTIGRLASGGNPIQMKASKAETVLVRLDVSYEDAIPRYYLELPEIETNLLFHEDFSLMTWGGDYYTYYNGFGPVETADIVDGTEVATKKADYTQAPFGNKPFDQENATYIKNRGLEDWTFEYCCERPFALQVGHDNGAGSVTTPAFSFLTETTNANLHLDLARFGGKSTGVKITVEILGAGTFDAMSCLGSRDAYTCDYGTYSAMLDVNLSENDCTFSEDGKSMATSSNGQGKILPRVYNNNATFKPHTKLNLRILGADASTKIKIYGEANSARFTIFDLKLGPDEGTKVNGTVIEETNTLYGLARDVTTGKPIVGLPVTDGFTYAITDANGVYQMVKNEKARCVYPSIPAEYEIPMDEGNQPLFYQYIKGETQRYDFNLSQRTSSWDDFTIMAITDVHFYTSGANQTNEENKFKQYHVPDMVNYLASASTSGEISRNVIGISLGDNTSNYTEKLSYIKNNLYSLITYNGAPLPLFCAIGNHDHRGDKLTDFECVEDYVNVFGPTDYSINIGKAHIVFMDNTMCVEEDQPMEYGKAMSFDRGITDEQWAWLQADLKNVKNKEDKLFIFCVHAPITSTTHPHFADIRNQLKTFGESHIMSGHLHKEITRDFTDGWTGKKGRVSQEHNLLALGGSWVRGWKDKISVDGTPMGYNVFNVSGNMIKESIYNPVEQEDDYQFRIYLGSDKYEDDINITRDGKDYTYKFDWTSHFQEKYKDDTMDMSGKYVVRVFAAGSRQKYWEVYLVDSDGKRTKMEWHEKEIVDICSLAFFYRDDVRKYNADYSTTTAKNVWTVDVPEAYKSDPEKAFSEGGYKVVAEYKSPGGKVFTYESNHVQSTKKKYGFWPYEYYYDGFTY